MAQVIQRPGYRVWLDRKIGRTEFWSYERDDGKGSGGNFRSQEAAETRAQEVLATIARRAVARGRP